MRKHILGGSQFTVQDNKVEAGMYSEVPGQTQRVNSGLRDQYLILVLCFL